MNVAAKAEQKGRQADDSEWMDNAVRVGLVSYGIVHLIVAWLALQLVFGGGGGSASQQGAIKQIASNDLGRLSLFVVAFGFLALVVWQALEAIWGHRDADGGKRVFKRVASAVKVVVYASLGITAFTAATGGRSSSGGTDGTTAKIMKMPAGPFLVVLLGIVVIGVAGYLAWRGWKEKFRTKLDGSGQTGKDGDAYVLFGKAGYLAKGVALAIVGLLFVYAGATHDPKKSGGMDQALHQLLQQPFGSVLLTAVALGLAGYGLFCFAWAKHLER